MDAATNVKKEFVISEMLEIIYAIKPEIHKNFRQ